MRSRMCMAAHVGPAGDCELLPSLLGSSQPTEPPDFLILQTHYYSTVAVWCSGRALFSVNVVNQRPARLILGWMTVRGFESRLQSPGV